MHRTKGDALVEWGELSRRCGNRARSQHSSLPTGPWFFSTRIQAEPLDARADKSEKVERTPVQNPSSPSTHHPTVSVAHWSKGGEWGA